MTWVDVFTWSCVLLITYLIVKTLYNLYWHPLSRFAGPTAFACSHLPYVYHHVTGNLAAKFLELHDRYGPIVRTAPNELSFNGPDAWNAIYNDRGQNSAVFPKNYDNFNETRNQISKSLFIAGKDDHPRMRKVLNLAFSEQALRDQEPRIQSHARSLIKQLEADARRGDGVIDINTWYNFAAFDIIADAALGQPFNTLETTTYRPWISMIGKTWKAITLASSVKSLAPPAYLLRSLVPTGLFLQKEVDKFDLVLNRVKERISCATDRVDLLSRVLRHNFREKHLTNEEIVSNATLFVAAGTEPVSTVLSALTYLISKDQRARTKLVAEIRDEFQDEESITIQRVSQLEYLTACIHEALRRFPPIPEGLPRKVPPSGDWVSGNWIPGGVSIVF
ncbi:MAG: hypothetical protein Q9219_004434 [cf. Caloplaca sp. 3 TL-2023]